MGTTVYLSLKTSIIIKRCGLSKRFIGDLVRKKDYEYETGYYKFVSKNEKINRAVEEWYDKMIDNRRRLLGSEMLHLLSTYNIDLK